MVGEAVGDMVDEVVGDTVGEVVGEFTCNRTWSTAYVFPLEERLVVAPVLF